MGVFIGENTVNVNCQYFKIGRHWRSLFNSFTQISNLFQKLGISHNTPRETCEERPENKKLMGFQEILIFYQFKSTKYRYVSSWQLICNCQRIYFLDRSFMNFVMNSWNMVNCWLLFHLLSCNEKSIWKQISLVGVHALSVTVTQWILAETEC